MMQHAMKEWEGKFGKTVEQIEAERKLERERRAAEADMAVRYANLHMPEDIRSRAKVWGMEAWAEVLWNNAFQSGYREALRALSPQQED